MTPRKQLDAFLAKFSPDVARIARAALRTMHARLPGATAMVYDNYNALVIGFGPSARASDAIVSIVVYPRWVSLFLFDGVDLDDPEAILKGTGKRIRHLVLRSHGDLDTPAIVNLMTQALRIADPPLDPRANGTLIIKSVSAKQRPRRAAPRRRHLDVVRIEG